MPFTNSSRAVLDGGVIRQTPIRAMLIGVIGVDRRRVLNALRNESEQGKLIGALYNLGAVHVAGTQLGSEAITMTVEQK